MQKLALTFGSDADPIQGGWEQSELARFKSQIALGMPEGKAAPDQAEDLNRRAAQMEAEPPFDLAQIDAEERIIDEEPDFER